MQTVAFHVWRQSNSHRTRPSRPPHGRRARRREESANSINLDIVNTGNCKTHQRGDMRASVLGSHILYANKRGGPGDMARLNLRVPNTYGENPLGHPMMKDTPEWKGQFQSQMRHRGQGKRPYRPEANAAFRSNLLRKGLAKASVNV